MTNRSLLVLILTLALPVVAAAEPSPSNSSADPAHESAAELGAQSAEDLIAQSGDDTDGDLSEDADEGDDDASEDDDGVDWPFGWSIGTGVSTSAGNIFRQDLPIEERDESVLNTWMFGVSKEFVDGFSGALGWGFYKYLTTTGGSTLQREARINDLAINLAYGPVYVIPRADISISASLGSMVPLSRMSRTSTLRTRISPGLAFARSFGNLALGYRFGASKNFHRFTSPVVDATEVDAIRRVGGAEDISANEVAEAGVNTEWSVSHGLSLSYTWIDNFSTSLAWGYGMAWGYDVTDCDEFSSEFADCSNRVVRDSMTGGISAAYSFLDNYSVSLSALTAQRPKTGDNRRVNFPFWDIQSPGLFLTSLSLDVGVSF